MDVNVNKLDINIYDQIKGIYMHNYSNCTNYSMFHVQDLYSYLLAHTHKKKRKKEEDNNHLKIFKSQPKERS